jgi:hypothetical protein
MGPARECLPSVLTGAGTSGRPTLAAYLIAAAMLGVVLISAGLLVRSVVRRLRKTTRSSRTLACLGRLWVAWRLLCSLGSLAYSCWRMRGGARSAGGLSGATGASGAGSGLRLRR